MNRRRLLTLGLAAAAPGQEVRRVLEAELQKSRPDYVVYVPGHWDGSTHDGLNEHFLVFDGPEGSMLAIWTQADDRPGRPRKNRIRFSRSADEGGTWARPTLVVGPENDDDPAPMASWAFPMVSQRGRIYVIYNQNDGSKGWIEMHTGWMYGVYSDDNGRSWSRPQRIEMPRSPYDDPEGKCPPEWIVWQIPMRDRKGGWFVGYTHWLHPARARWKKVNAWVQIESVVEFMRFVNVDRDPQPRDLEIRWSGWGEKALRAPYWRDPLLSVAQEPSLVRLPDQRLFCVMRTNSGYIWYSVSGDDGETWCSPRPLLRKDFGEPILQPVGCCPIYQLADGRYILLHHNNRGDFESKPEASHSPRRPAYLALGEFRPKADQPVWFSESKEFMDNGDVGVDGSKNHRQKAIGVYTSFTTRRGNNVLWHPDRKFFLVGKRVTPEFLAGLVVPR
jgi:hypothetical protein